MLPGNVRTSLLVELQVKLYFRTHSNQFQDLIPQPFKDIFRRFALIQRIFSGYGVRSFALLEVCGGPCLFFARVKH